MGTSRLILCLCFCGVVQMSQAMVTPTTQRIAMNSTDLDALNKEVRTALLEKVNAELHAAKTYMSSLEPGLTNCRVKVNNSLGNCAKCVDSECQNKYKDCQSLSINMQTPGGASISTTSIDGKSEIKICSLMGLQHVCQIIMNPDGFLVNGISQIGNTLQIHLQKLTSNLGNGVVTTFIDGLQSVGNGTGWSKEDAAEFNADMDKLKDSLHNMGQDIQQSMHSMSTGLHNSLSGLHHTLSGMGQSLQNWGTNFAHQLSQSLSNMFQGTFLGRKKRAAPHYCQALMSDVSSCSMFTTQCASCPSTVSKHLMASVCGQTLVNKVQAAEKSMNEVDQISKEVMSTPHLLIQVKGTPLNQKPPAFNNIVVTAVVRGNHKTFNVATDIDTSNLKRAGVQLANKIWKEWAINMPHP